MNCARISTIFICFLVLAGCSAPVRESTKTSLPIIPPPITNTPSPTKTHLPDPIDMATSSPSVIKAENNQGKIVFYSERDGNAEIYTMNPDGSDQHRLTFNQFQDNSPIWSPTGDQIAFISDRDDPNRGSCFPDCFFQLYIINADGRNEHRLIESGLTTHHPDWHPNGLKLSFDTEFNLEGDIYLLNIDGSSPQLLIEDGFWADWSPDGSQIVFASNRDGNIEIYLSDADGGNQQRLTDNTRMDYFPTWSPDGRKIAFMAGDGRERQIFVMNSDGSDEHQLTTKGRVNEDPAWSPTGEHIVFQTNRNGNYEIYYLEVEKALRGDSEPQRLTNTSAGDYWPSYSSRSNLMTEIEVPPGTQRVVSIPQDLPPVIDGRISPDEWHGAQKETFRDGSELLLLQSEGYLYLGIRANTTEMIVGNIFINQGQDVSILHISAALGTAIYQQEAETWKQIKEFEWCCRATGYDDKAEAEREAFFQKEGWTAVNSRIGTPNELEYKIKIGDDNIRLAVNYLKATANPNDEKMPWPPTLDDDCIKPTPGGLPIEFSFTPEKWVRLEF